jgi:hypothetical protein
VAHNDRNKATGKSAGFRHVLDAAGRLLPEWQAIIGAQETVSTPAPASTKDSDVKADGDVFIVHVGRLVRVLSADDTDVTEQDRQWLRELLWWALEHEPELVPAPAEPIPDSGTAVDSGTNETAQPGSSNGSAGRAVTAPGGTLASEQQLAALRADLAAGRRR